MVKSKQHKLTRSQQRKRPKLRRWILHKFGDGTQAPCAGCGEMLTNDTMTIDRWPIPGRDGGQYWRNNIRPMCHPCNTSHVGESAAV